VLRGDGVNLRDQTGKLSTQLPLGCCGGIALQRLCPTTPDHGLIAGLLTEPRTVYDSNLIHGPGLRFESPPQPLCRYSFTFFST
jgi:hypothetical protein